MEKIVVVLSGGVDSATLLYDLHHRGHLLKCLSFDYGQRHRRELARTMQRMLHGLSFGDVLFDEKGTVITMTFAPGIRGDYPFTTIDMVREGEYLALGVIR